MNPRAHRSFLAGTDLHYRVRGGSPILRGVDLRVPAGSITGVLGPNGAGKSTLLRILIGALQPASGELTIDAGEGPTQLSSIPRLTRARLLALVEQDSHPHEDLTVGEVVALGRLPHQGRFGGYCQGGAARTAAARTGVEHMWDRAFSTLSGGERQRVHLARALAQEPEFLLLDEPSNHLDLAAQADLLTLLQEVAATGMGVLLTLHDLTIAARACSAVVVLDGGAVVAAGAPRQVLTSALIHRVWGVDAQWVDSRFGPALIVATGGHPRP